MEYAVEMLGIRKEFPGVVACDDLTLQLRKGEIHALLGENGAGKSTLMSILFGLYQADRGSIRVKGKEVRISSPNIATALGIGMVHQHFKLVHNFTVTENIALGSETTRGPVLDLHSVAARIKELSAQYGLNVDPEAKISAISVGMQQRVEILKMLYRNADILIFDEPTSVLTPQEVQELLKIMGSMTAEGKSVILITHKLKEIRAIAHRCTVIRRGRLIGTVDVASTAEETLAEMMVGRKVLLHVEKGKKQAGKTVLRVENLSVRNNRGVLGLQNFSLEVRCGEIVGLAGVDGNGQSELVEAVTGLRKPEGGKVWLQGKDVTALSVRERTTAGLAFIPDDRHKYGLVLDFSLEDNLVLKRYYREPFSGKGLLRREAIHNYAEKIIRLFDVRSGQGTASPARSLSGGNQQKAIVGREIDLNPDLLLAVQPTRGLDVGAIEYIHRRLIEQRDAGRAVLLVSLELSEIMALADRIAVVNNGELVGVVEAEATDENEVGLMMAGVKRGGAA
jgi:simple sugar transport system ATP-binding protein